MPRACVVCEHLSITAVTCIANRLLFIVTRMFIDVSDYRQLKQASSKTVHKKLNKFFEDN